MKEWIIAGWLHLIVGFVLGWIVCKRPQWVEAAIAWVKAKIRGN